MLVCDCVVIWRVDKNAVKENAVGGTRSSPLRRLLMCTQTIFDPLVSNKLRQTVNILFILLETIVNNNIIS